MVSARAGIEVYATGNRERRVENEEKRSKTTLS